eukprot:TRINITY_DN25742_c0_g11_i1.p1 TRINITY_DN25742_c0_g11~~TRINITY_DN25742_c0_g11_i1.p1  ORF type:complete len:276 (-),score=35.21 TRINITY_DN25742_c0_g11_i1:46-798(-)
MASIILLAVVIRAALCSRVLRVPHEPESSSNGTSSTKLDDVLHIFESMGSKGPTVDSFFEAGEATVDLLKGLSTLHDPGASLGWLDSPIAFASFGSGSCSSIYPFTLAEKIVQENLDKGYKAKTALEDKIEPTAKPSVLDTGAGSNGSDALFWVGTVWKFMFKMFAALSDSPSTSLVKAGTVVAEEVFKPINQVMMKGLQVGLKCAPTKEQLIKFIANGGDSKEELVLQRMKEIALASRAFMDLFPFWDF